MPIRDETDLKLISELRRDGRAAISTLAGRLGVARGTVQARLDRLVSDGTIRRFTIDTRGSEDVNAIRAIMSIEIQGSAARAATRTLRGMPEVTALHTTNGAWDLIAELRTDNLPAFDRVLRDIRSIPGVLNSETSILLDTI
ncbi:DNA-binding Lrp family transcriptional regulator [Rubricella aquisinus]|uniref:DNA-binding Lrp family transcriptional regulator n=1 Tax=Rubricella aquisinus TaxID=2028108 RepID=A0A840WNI0_9RHOB|nr:Lrp/AsnC family transcriptional regulator [Rubricella aquisinus]MBB5515212.1 DNA-binding Lrp family transcriptional regulator [Rubricella aquisinus]